MKKRNLLPTQTAPVERDNTASSCQGQNGLTPGRYDPQGQIMFHPFAADDAE